MSKKHIPEEQLFNYIMNDLPLEKCADIENHLELCTECRNHKTRMTRYLQLLKNESIYEADEDALIRSRNRLATKMEISTKKLSKWHPNRILSKIPSHIETRRLVWAAIIFTGGLCIGRFFWPVSVNRSNSDLLATLSSTPAENYRIIQSSTNPAEVEVYLKSIEEQTLRANINDPDIQTALAYALLNEKNDNSRFQTMDLIRFVSQNETVEAALLETLANDPNPGLRYRAIKLLKHFPLNEKMKNLLIRVLFQDTNPGVRIQVTEKLIQSNDPDVMPLLKKRAEKDEYVQYVLDAADTKQALSISHD